MPQPMAPYQPRPFRPAWWLRGGHAHTIAGKLLRPTPNVPLRRERLDTPDGDFLDLDYAPEPGPHAPVALVLHGLEGSARRHYMKLTYVALGRAGIQGVGLNFRSCSAPVDAAAAAGNGGGRGGLRFQPNRRPRFYHSGETGDVLLALEHLRARFPGRALGAAGFSLGGNALLKLLGEAGESRTSPVSAAVAVSVPFDLAAGARRLEQGLLSRVYTHYFIRSLREKAVAKAPLLAEACDLDAVTRARTLREFDDAATAPLHGYRDAEDYYARCSSGPFLPRIAVPTLLLHALDDPFLPPEAVPVEAARDNPCITAHFTPSGGHVGFVSGPPSAPSFWAEEEAARFLAAHLRPVSAG